ncbi:MAG: hypothetical protein ACQCN5_08205 [Candidatus Bathyarchaeia archaeon]|jgi:hypothetical protein
MENNSKIESENYFREVRKLEVRLEEYLKEEEIFVQKIRNCITQLKALHTLIEPLTAPVNPETAEKISKLKTEAVAALGEAMKLEGHAEHEKSHLLESYGALIVALNKLSK